MTFKVGEQIVQLCFYPQPTLKALVDSFDFAHIQVGVHIHIGDVDGLSIATVSSVYHTEAWVTSHAMQTTWYTGSEYPLSSLLRSIKYASRGDFAGKSYIPSAINILKGIIKRGFSGYEDFKDQLDAVDLGLIEKDLEGCNISELFELLRRDK